jgi:hypothetical protein
VGYAVITFIGAALSGAAAAGGVRALRYAGTVLAVTWLASYLGKERMLRLLVYFAAFVAGASLLAAAGQGGTGRLAGFLPPMHPNALGTMSALGLVIAVGLRLSGSLRIKTFTSCAVPLLLATALTESRTALLASVIALTLTLLLSSRDLRVSTALAVPSVVAACALILVDGNSIRLDPIANALTRGGETSIDSTLTGRSFAWDRVIAETDTTAETLFGRGTQAKTVAVDRPFVDRQVIDGTLFAALYQAGAIGLGLLAIAAALAVIRLLREGGLSYVPTAAVLVIMSWPESLLNDVTFGAVLLFLLAAPATAADEPRCAARLDF